MPFLVIPRSLLRGGFIALLAGLYAANRVLVADVARAFHADDFRLVPALDVPVNVVLVCQLTWMCAPPPQGPNIHPTFKGLWQCIENFPVTTAVSKA
jgi:hypothetical protein